MKSEIGQRKLIVQSTYALLYQSGLTHSLQILYDSINSLVLNNQPIPQTKYITIKAVYGILSLSVNKYLIVVTKSDIVAQIFSSRVHRVKSVSMIVLSSQQNYHDVPLKQQIISELQSGSYYYSDQYDLTRTVNYFINNRQTIKHQQRNNRYFYNHELMKEFIKLNAQEWITAFIHGSIVFNYFNIISTQFNCSFMLLSRMDRERQGARWFCRGCDSNGHTSFKVETEVVFIGKNRQKRLKNIFSFFQVRGQIPLVWSQIPDILWQPQIYLLKNEKLNIQIIKRYLMGLKEKHHSVCLVNLLDRNNQNQKKLGQYYENLLKLFPLQNIRHAWFQFKYLDVQYNLTKSQSILIQKLGQFLKNYGYYQMQIKQNDKEDVFTQKHEQTGLFRMTSMDCLMRVDLTQRVISKQMLQQWIYKIGVITDKQHNHSQKLPESLQEIFNTSWAINSHRLSKIYTGTTNIKQQIISKKQRRKRSRLMDHFNILRRYIIGTFYDWNKQNINDILTGKLQCKGKSIRTTTHRYFLGVFGIILALIWAVFEIVQEALQQSKINSLLPIQMFWSFLAVFALFLVVKNNRFLPKPEIHY